MCLDQPARRAPAGCAWAGGGEAGWRAGASPARSPGSGFYVEGKLSLWRNSGMLPMSLGGSL